jgi:hypothetical protein
MRSYSCDDGNAEITIEADSPEEAAQEYVDGGDWGDDAKTFWVDVWVTRLDDDGEPAGEREQVTITVDPEEPDCAHEAGHAWARPYELIGGLKEAPGVSGHGGGVQGRDVCLLCGLARDWDNWAQRPSTGEQGLDSVEYVGDAFAVEVHASEGERHAVEINDDCYVVECDGDDEAQLQRPEVGEAVSDYTLTEDGWEAD